MPGPDAVCRCGHSVRDHMQNDPGWCRLCDDCQFQEAERAAGTPEVSP